MGRYFPQAEYEERWKRVEAEMKRRGYDVAVIWSRGAGTYCRSADVLYLANYYSTWSGQGFVDAPHFNGRSFSAVILKIGEEPEIHVDEPAVRHDLLAMDRVKGCFDPIDPFRSVADSLRERKIEGKVALVGSDIIPMKYWLQFSEQTPKVAWKVENDLVEAVRRIKSARELDAVREAGKITTRALDKLMKGLLSGKTEAEAAADAAHEVVKAGGAIHMIESSHGELIEFFARHPLTGYSQDIPKDGDLIRAWLFGPIFEGYYLDPGRTAVFGRRPNAAQRALVEDCASVTEKIMAACRPGASVVELGRLGDKLMQEVGFTRDFASTKWPLYGHSVGLYFEQPVISVKMGREGDLLQPGMVLGVEVFLAREGVGSSGFEQNLIVLEDENEVLTTSPMLWW